MKTRQIALFSLGFLLSLLPVCAEITVSSDFPGGSGEVVAIDQSARLIRLNPTDHPDKGWRCWWYVRLDGLTSGETLTLDVGEAPWATPDRATFSTDGGETWRQSEKGTRDGRRIRYALRFEAESALVAWGPPFLPGDAKTLVDELSHNSPHATAFTLCETREGRETPALRVRQTDAQGELPLIWVQARQHAWESGSSWVGKGFATWLVSDAAEAIALRRRHEVVFVPIMDIDNVFRGAGGKNQKPQDHNRDWTDQPHWHAVRAAQAEMRAAAENGRLAAFIDLHNPGANDKFPFFYVPPGDLMSEAAHANHQRFYAACKEEMTGPLRFTGKTIVSGPGYDPKAWKAISKNWVVRLGTPAISVTLETSWNTPASTPDGYQTVGRQLGLGLNRALK